MVRADELGWQGLANGALLDAADQAGFELLLTCDRNVRYQQNFASRRLALVVLSSNHWPTLRPKAARIAATIDFVQTGQVVTIDLGPSFRGWRAWPKEPSATSRPDGSKTMGCLSFLIGPAARNDWRPPGRACRCATAGSSAFGEMESNTSARHRFSA